jgi:hypothetical protein
VEFCRVQFLDICFLLFYINDLPKIINKDNNMVLYADDTSIIISDTNNFNFKTNLSHTFKDINTWFKVNLLTLNFKKTQYLEFRSMNGCSTVNQINYDQGSISSVTETMFLDLIIDDALSWKQHSDLVINRLSSTCYALRSIRHIVSFAALRLVYSAQVQSIMSYGIVGLSPRESCVYHCTTTAEH